MSKISSKKLMYDSSSSVYGNNTKTTFSTDDRTDESVSLYATTKKSNELMLTLIDICIKYQQLVCVFLLCMGLGDA